MISPHKQLIFDSEQYILLVNSKEYITLQKKFDKLYLQTKQEQEVLKQFLRECKENINNFRKIPAFLDNTPKSSDQEQKIDPIDNNIKDMNKEIKGINNTLDDYNFISRF